MRNTRWHELTSAECRRLLAKRRLGRVAVVQEDGPAVYPVRYTIEGGALVFSTDASTELDSTPVVLQVDELDEGGDAGWSVTVRGEAREVSPAELGQLHRLEPRGGRYVRLRQTSITGRRIGRQVATVPTDLPSNFWG